MARGGVLSPRGAKSSKSFTALVRHVPSVLDVIKLDLSFRKRIQMLSNSSGLLRYGTETVLTGLQRFLPPVWALTLAGHSMRFSCLKYPRNAEIWARHGFATKWLDTGDDSISVNYCLVLNERSHTGALEATQNRASEKI